jgi:hypothetical protein
MLTIETLATFLFIQLVLTCSLQTNICRLTSSCHHREFLASVRGTLILPSKRALGICGQMTSIKNMMMGQEDFKDQASNRSCLLKLQSQANISESTLEIRTVNHPRYTTKMIKDQLFHM